ncbi:Bug family tripartite tricarboxylate transporter substrate binding protein [Phreatobacter stygius]|uniref:Tripartite tricarboxylate transporter substrate binding protein n=1 Tax=Phreatobacter stygius TaxID=1940610 RepID=A0A4D7B7Q2_9HYPH|nr:tripartite tricarboxylate transporter substrate-binding protein [Phreatobacter stygius]QCI64172.1 tripartite tricarboxylate transporter substrate binding protein [Phreatobacter stygius]
MLKLAQRIGSALLGMALTAGVADAAWQPSRPVEFVVTSSPGGGTDNFARVVQSIIAKYKLFDRPIVVVNKGGGSGAEGYIYARTVAADPHKLIFGTNNAYLLPYVARLAYKLTDLTPVAGMALDEFVLWVNGGSEYRSARAFLDAVRARPEAIKMGGSQSRDTDQTLTGMIETAASVKFIYVPFQGGGAAANQLAGGHIDSNTNNPNENIGQWKAGQVRPLCVFSVQRLAAGPRVTADMGWADIPTCREEGIPIDRFQMPRTVWLPANVPADAVAFYADVLKKVSETPEWQDYIARTVQTGVFLTGPRLTSFITDDEAKSRAVFEQQGWIVR